MCLSMQNFQPFPTEGQRAAVRFPVAAVALAAACLAQHAAAQNAPLSTTVVTATRSETPLD